LDRPLRERIVSAGGNTLPPFCNALDASQIASASERILEPARRAPVN
jgi:hypothetical protein